MYVRLFALAGLLAGLLAPSLAHTQEQLGHKALGTIGLDAGVQPRPGIYVADRLFFFAADRLYDRSGDRIPVTPRLRAVANALGASAVFRLPWLETHLTISAGVPLTRVTAQTERPEASIDRFGLGDIYVQPVRLGWRLARFDLVTSYGFYAPTGRFDPGGRGGVGQGQWTHELSAGGTLYFDEARGWKLTALASYDEYGQKRGIDITRGATLNVQGGAGVTLFRIVEAGLVAYALWQVEDDRGSDLPPALRGARDRAYGLGPELSLRLPPIRGKLTLRYTHDVSVRSRPLGQVLVAGLSIAVWQPKP